MGVVVETRISYEVLSPGGNITALVRDTVSREAHAAIARRIMEGDPSIEQVGFIEPPTQKDVAFRLQMMGGEFCVGASLAAAFLLGEENRQLSFEVSGFEEVVMAKRSHGSVELLVPGSIVSMTEKCGGGVRVDLIGIRFVVLSGPCSAREARMLIRQHKGTFPAVGAIQTSSTRAGLTIVPHVWVRDTDTYIEETACGSGSIAAVLACAGSEGEVCVLQPSGTMYKIAITREGDGIKQIVLRAPVLYRGKRIS